MNFEVFMRNLFLTKLIVFLEWLQAQSNVVAVFILFLIFVALLFSLFVVVKVFFLVVRWALKKKHQYLITARKNTWGKKAQDFSRKLEQLDGEGTILLEDFLFVVKNNNSLDFLLDGNKIHISKIKEASREFFETQEKIGKKIDSLNKENKELAQEAIANSINMGSSIVLNSNGNIVEVQTKDESDKDLIKKIDTALDVVEKKTKDFCDEFGETKPPLTIEGLKRQQIKKKTPRQEKNQDDSGAIDLDKALSIGEFFASEEQKTQRLTITPKDLQNIGDKSVSHKTNTFNENLCAGVAHEHDKIVRDFLKKLVADKKIILQERYFMVENDRTYLHQDFLFSIFKDSKVSHKDDKKFLFSKFAVASLNFGLQQDVHFGIDDKGVYLCGKIILGMQ